MKWDYYTYMAQPMFFLNAIKDVMLKEQREHAKSMKQSSMKNNIQSKNETRTTRRF